MSMSLPMLSVLLGHGCLRTHRSIACPLPGSEATPTQPFATAGPVLGAGVELSLGRSHRNRCLSKITQTGNPALGLETVCIRSRSLGKACLLMTMLIRWHVLNGHAGVKL